MLIAQLGILPAAAALPRISYTYVHTIMITISRLELARYYIM